MQTHFVRCSYAAFDLANGLAGIGTLDQVAH